jgi:hypothetical protein
VLAYPVELPPILPCLLGAVLAVAVRRDRATR